MSVNKLWKPSKKTVELDPAVRPSRIRRDPPPPARMEKAVSAYPSEREVWTVVIGVVLFALALAIITLGISDATS